MFSFKTFALALIAVSVWALTSGCAAKAEKLRRKNQLMEIALAAHNFNDANNGKAPTKADDLKPFLESGSNAYAALKDGQFVMIWGVSISELSKSGGVSNTVLVYEKDAPQQGGQVAFADGSVREMTAAEFNAAKKATPAKTNGGAP